MTANIRAGDISSSEGVIRLFINISSILQIILFLYLFAAIELKQRSPWKTQCFELFIFAFFIVAMVLSEYYAWAYVNLEIYKDAHILGWIGVFLCIYGNFLFLWILYYLYNGVQSPMFINRLSMGQNLVENEEIDAEKYMLLSFFCGGDTALTPSIKTVWKMGRWKGKN